MPGQGTPSGRGSGQRLTGRQIGGSTAVRTPTAIAVAVLLVVIVGAVALQLLLGR
jgi:hypothetical protein